MKLVVLVVGLALPALVLASNWPKRDIGLPGYITAGSTYCDEAGVCHIAGEAEHCTATPRPRSDPCWSAGVPPGSACRPRQECRPATHVGEDLPVQVFAEYLNNGFVQVRAEGRLYVVNPSLVFVLEHGERVRMDRYSFCHPPLGSTSVVAGQLVDSDCR